MKQIFKSIIVIAAAAGLSACSQPGQIETVSPEALEALAMESASGADFDYSDDPLWQDDNFPVVDSDGPGQVINPDDPDAGSVVDNDPVPKDQDGPTTGIGDCAGFYEWKGDPKEGGNEDFGTMDIHVDANGLITGTFFSDYNGTYPLTGFCYAHSKRAGFSIMDLKVGFAQGNPYPFTATVIPGQVRMITGYMNLLFDTAVFKGIERKY